MSEKRKPLAVYTITTRDGAAAESAEPSAGGEERNEFWTRIGTAFPHPNGQGFNLMLNALPLNNKLVLLPPKERDQTSSAA